MASLLRFINPFLLPLTLLALCWFLYRWFVKKDRPALLLLILAVIVIVDAYMSTGIYLPGLERGSIRYSEILMAFYFISHIRDGEKYGLQKTVYIRKINRLCLIFLILFLISILRSDNVPRNLLYSYRQIALAPIIVYLFASWGFQAEGDYKRFSYYLLAFAVFVSLGSYQMMYLDYIFIKSPTEDVFYQAVHHGRFGSFFGNPNRLGSFYVLTVPTFLMTIFYIRKWFFKVAVFIMILAILFALFKTFSRGSYLGLMVAMSAFMFFKIKGFPLRSKLAMILIVLVAIPFFAPNIYTGVMKRFSTISEEKDAMNADQAGVTEKERLLSRPFLWSSSLIVSRENPFFGIGWGYGKFVRTVYRLHMEGVFDRNEARALWGAEHPHNSYIYIAVFLGYIALAVFLLLLLVFFKSNLTFFRKCKSDDLRLINFGFFCGIVGYLATATFGYQLFEKNISVPFWVMVGLNLSLLMHVNKQEKQISD